MELEIVNDDEQEESGEKVKGRWFGVGCRIYHIYLPYLVVIGGSVVVLGVLGWDLFRRSVLGQPRRPNFGVGEEWGAFVLDVVAAVIIASVIGYVLYWLAGRWLTWEACASEFDVSRIYPNGVPWYLKWVWGGRERKPEYRSRTVGQGARKRKRWK